MSFFLSDIVSKLQSAVEFLKSHVSTLDDVAGVLGTLKEAADAAANLFNKKTTSTRAAKDSVSEEESCDKLEAMKADVLSSCPDTPVSVKAIPTAGISWIAVIAPLVMNLIQTILDNLKKKT